MIFRSTVYPLIYFLEPEMPTKKDALKMWTMILFVLNPSDQEKRQFFFQRREETYSWCLPGLCLNDRMNSLDGYYTYLEQFLLFDPGFQMTHPEFDFDFSGYHYSVFVCDLTPHTEAQLLQVGQNKHFGRFFTFQNVADSFHASEGVEDTFYLTEYEIIKCYVEMKRP